MTVDAASQPDEALLERDAETAALADLLAGAAAGHGGAVLVEAAPGLGKSALLARTAHLAREAGLDVIRARGHELEREFGWGVARSLLERPVAALTAPDREDLLTGPAAPARAVVDPGHAAPGAADATGFAVLHALHWVVLRVAERAPTVVLVDDAHWADEPSLRLLTYLVGRISDEPIAIVIAARAGEPGPGGLLAPLAADPALRILSPSPLGPSAVGTLVRRGGRDADDAFCLRCFELTGGNPLQIRELLAALADQGGRSDAGALAAATATAARSLGRSVLGRLGTMTADAQSLAFAVAVLEDAPLSLAAALSAVAIDSADRARDELVGADLLRDDDPIGFTHPLLRAAVHAGLPPGERGRMHRRAALLLSEAGGQEERASAHLLQSPAGADPTVVELLRTAARSASGRGAPASAADYLDRALREPPAPDARTQVIAELGRAEAAAGRPAAAEHLRAAADATSRGPERLALLLDLGRALQHAGDMPGATTTFLRGLEEVRPGAGELAADLEAGYLAAAMHAPDRATEAHRRADVIIAEGRHETPAERALLCNAMMLGFFAGRPRHEALAVVRRLYAGGALVDGFHDDPTTLIQVVGVLSWSDEYDEAAEALRRAFAVARRDGSVFRYAMASQVRARQLVRTGPVGDAVEDARTAVDAWRGGQQAYLHAASHCLVVALLESDRLGDAAAVLANTDEGGTRSVSAWRHMAVGLVAAHEERHEDALDAFLAAGRRLDALLVTNPTVIPWRSQAGLAARRLGRDAQARELIDDELALARGYGAPYAIGTAQTAGALLARGEESVTTAARGGRPARRRRRARRARPRARAPRRGDPARRQAGRRAPRAARGRRGRGWRRRDRRRAGGAGRAAARGRACSRRRHR